jgi:thioredoxin 1
MPEKLKNGLRLVFVIIIVAVLCVSCGNAGAAGDDSDDSVLASFPLEKALENGLPTVAEFGWNKCVPCKAMKPILEELAIEYKDKANILIVEIPHHEDLAEKYGINVMPIQIFFDANGREVVRHTGFLEKEEIINQLKRMGVQ